VADQEPAPSEDVRKVRFVYRRSPDYRTIAVSGAWGGLTGTGDLRAHLYVEGGAPPEASEVSVRGDMAGPEVVVAPKPEDGLAGIVEREVQISLVMSPRQAKNLGKWLLDRYAEWLALRRQGLLADEEGKDDGSH